MSNREEDQLRKDIKAQGLKKCDDVVRSEFSPGYQEHETSVSHSEWCAHF